jgi:alpha-L-fucosidase
LAEWSAGYVIPPSILQGFAIRNKEFRFATRNRYPENPAQESAAALTAQGFNESGGKPFSSLDYRFTTKGNSLYAIAIGWPENGKALIKILSKGNSLRPEPVNCVEFLGHGNLKFEQNEEGLEIILPDNKPELHYAYSLKIC